MVPELNPSRRAVLWAAGSAGVAVTVTACGASDAPTPTPSVRSGAALAKVADVPVGGGVILPDEKLVLTQPQSGEFKAYSAVCTHQGCLVSAVRKGFIECSCHGSRFAVATGVPTDDSPAKKPLSAAAVTVKGTDVVAT